MKKTIGIAMLTTMCIAMFSLFVITKEWIMASIIFAGSFLLSVYFIVAVKLITSDPPDETND